MCSGVVLLGPSVLYPIFWTLQTDFQSGCTSLQSHQQRRSVPLSSLSCQHLLSPEFLILATLTGLRWNLSLVLICISLMIKVVEHFFRFFSSLWYSSVENSLALYPIFLVGLFDSLESNFLSSLYILDISSLLDVRLYGSFPNLVVAVLYYW